MKEYNKRSILEGRKFHIYFKSTLPFDEDFPKNDNKEEKKKESIINIDELTPGDEIQITLKMYSRELNGKSVSFLAPSGNYIGCFTQEELDLFEPKVKYDKLKN